MNITSMIYKNRFDPSYEHFANIYSLLPKNAWCLFSFFSIGDAYILGTLLKSFHEFHVNHLNTNRILVFTYKHYVPILSLFTDGLSNVEIIGLEGNQININYLLKHGMFLPGFPIVAHPINYGDHNLDFIFGYKNITYMDIFKIALRLPINCSITRPSISAEMRLRANEIWNSWGLPLGKTAILAPQAQTFKLLPNKFWDSLAKALKEKGWTVCTNSPNVRDAIAGTLPLSFGFQEAIPICENAGLVISLRSGFCDLISSAKSRLIVVNSDEQVNGEWMSWLGHEGFIAGVNLKANGLSDHAEEYIICNDKIELEIDKILKIL